MSLHKQSHGESFMSLLVNRLGGRGLYIFDEPEAALSPVRQMALVRRIHQLVELGSQLIIATHSPIVMSYPDSIIYDVDNGYEAVKYEETDHYRITREFLNNPDKMLTELFRG
ncbi:MAG: AAA family ATPase [Acidaminobacteraceae bacterium]